MRKLNMAKVIKRILIILFLLVISYFLIVIIFPINPLTSRKTNDEFKMRKTEAKMQNLILSLDCYRMFFGYYPTQEQGLQVIVSHGLNENLEVFEQYKSCCLDDEYLIDGWGNKFVYKAPSNKENQKFQIMSYGADGIQGGEGLNKDISNSDLVLKND